MAWCLLKHKDNFNLLYLQANISRSAVKQATYVSVKCMVNWIPWEAFCMTIALHLLRYSYANLWCVRTEWDDSDINVPRLFGRMDIHDECCSGWHSLSAGHISGSATPQNLLWIVTSRCVWHLHTFKSTPLHGVTTQKISTWRWRQHGPLKRWCPTTTLHGVTTEKISTWRWSQHGILKRWCPTTTLHGVTTQKNSTWIFTAVKAWKLAFVPVLCT
jgi:hypothetical protein